MVKIFSNSGDYSQWVNNNCLTCEKTIVGMIPDEYDIVEPSCQIQFNLILGYDGVTGDFYVDDEIAEKMKEKCEDYIEKCKSLSE
jgi:hypothetical protein